jgi:hypothetical protein
MWGLMADAKLEIKVGSVSFSGEGSEAWLAEQLDKWLETLPSLHEQSADNNRDDDALDEGDDAGEGTGIENKGRGDSLAAYLKNTKSTGNQARKFLATAAWLESNGKDRVTTGDVTKALSDHKQGKLTNASQCLANNVTAGKIVKDGKRQFYVSEDGSKDLKH